MKRIATYYDPRISGRNDGLPLYFTNRLKTWGPEIECEHFTGEDQTNMARFGKFDLHIWPDWGEDGLSIPYTMIEKLPSPSVYVPCDTHISDASREYRFKRADNSDFVFFNQKRGMEEYLKARPEREGKVFWLPCAAEPQAYPNKPIALKKYDIGFVGYVSFRKRAEMLDTMFKEFPNFWYGQRRFEEAAEIYRKSRIVFNTAADDDVNMRVFEATATGAFLLTEEVPHLDELFEIGKHLVTYKTIDEAIEKVKYYLEHAEEREAIAKAGMEHTLSHHTYRHRLETILDITGIIPGVDSKGESKSKKGLPEPLLPLSQD